MIKNIYAINVVYDNEIFNGNKQFAGMLGKGSKIQGTNICVVKDQPNNDAVVSPPLRASKRWSVVQPVDSQNAATRLKKSIR